MSKKIILCFDGTSNEPEDAVQKGNFTGPEDNSITNVLKLHLMLGGDLRESVSTSPQMSFYYQGVGTYGSVYKKLRNLAFSPEKEDVGTIIKRATKDLYQHYVEGDEIFIFGFSRGSAIARRFSSVIQKTFEAIDPTRIPKIKFLGVWDTVAAISSLNLFKEGDKPNGDVLFENCTLSESIEQAVHIVALDEKRIPFLPTLMNKEDKVLEIWFPGAHADIGGGYHYDGLADSSLQFMIEEMKRRNLGLTLIPPAEIALKSLNEGKPVIDLQDVMLQPNPLGKSHEQVARLFIKKAIHNDRTLRINIKDLQSMESPLLHHTVVDRIQAIEDYKPKSLSRSQMVNPYTEIPVEHKIWYGPEDIRTYSADHSHKDSDMEHVTQLKVGDSHEFMIYSNQHYSRSGVFVKEGETYQFTIARGQTWFDANIACGPEGWDRSSQNFSLGKNIAFAAMAKKRRHRDAQWFEVVGSLGKNDDSTFRILQHTKKSTAYSPASDEEIYAFANDLWKSYGNNLGTMKVKVKRLS